MANYVEILQSLLWDKEEQQKYDEDPSGYLAEKGIADDAPPEQIHEAVAMAYEKGPPDGLDAPPIAQMPPAPEQPPPTVQDAVKYYVDSANQPPADMDDRDPYADAMDKADYDEEATPLDDAAMAPDYTPPDDHDPTYDGDEPKFGEGEDEPGDGYAPDQPPQPEYQPAAGHQPDYKPEDEHQDQPDYQPEPQPDYHPEDEHQDQPDYDPHPEGDPHHQPEPDLDPAG